MAAPMPVEAPVTTMISRRRGLIELTSSMTARADTAAATRQALLDAAGGLIDAGGPETVMLRERRSCWRVALRACRHFVTLHVHRFGVNRFSSYLRTLTAPRLLTDPVGRRSPPHWLDARFSERPYNARTSDMRRLPSIALFLGAATCAQVNNVPRQAQHVPPSEAAPTVAAPTVLQSTAQLVMDPKLAVLVDRLAASDEIQSRAIGPQGVPGALYAVFATLSNIASPAQMIALSTHQSPVVRGYVIWYVARTPDKLGLLYPLLGDFTSVNLHSGCKTIPIPIAHLLLYALTEERERDSVQALLLRAARDPQLSVLRSRVMELLAKRQP